MKTVESLYELISDSRIHQEYSVREYIAFCNEIRSFWDSPGVPQTTIKFLEKKFVDEIEPLAKICQYLYGKNEENIRVQYLEADPPDGRIIVPAGQDKQEEICIEFTTAADKRKLNFAVEQMRKGIPTILTGYAGDDISGSRNKGYCVKGIPVDENSLFGDGESEEEAITDQKNSIEKAINRKLKNNWLNRKNWLCILIDDITDWNVRIELMMKPVFHEICNTYKDQLRLNHIEQLWFIGYKSYISVHSLEQVL